MGNSAQIVLHSMLLKVFAVFLVFAMVACNQETQADRIEQDPYEIGYSQIDQGQYEQAISTFQQIHSRTPSLRSELGLASAYAARAQIKVDSYWGFVVGFDMPLMSLESLQSSESLARFKNILNQFSNEKPYVLKTKQLQEFVQNLNQLEILLARLNSIPVLTPAQIADVDRALDILKNHSKEKSHASYRAILGLIVIKTKLVQGFDQWDKIVSDLSQLDFEHPHSEKNKKLLCQVPMKRFKNWYQSVIERVQVLFQDVAVSYPSKQNDAFEVQQFLNRIRFEYNEVSLCQ